MGPFLSFLLLCCVTVTLNGKEVKINARNFSCDKWSASPATDVYFSTGTPSVGLTHLFCGEIEGDKAKGFHSRPNNKDPPCAKAVEFTKQEGELRCYKYERVYDARALKWINRNVQGLTSGYCFFPKDWNITVTVDAVKEVYNHCATAGSIDTSSGNQICAQDYKGRNFDIILFLQADPVGPAPFRVVTAFAVPTKDKFVFSQCKKTVCKVQGLQ